MKCSICGKKLSSYNKNGQCYHHNEDRLHEILKTDHDSVPNFKRINCSCDNRIIRLKYC